MPGMVGGFGNISSNIQFFNNNNLIGISDQFTDPVNKVFRVINKEKVDNNNDNILFSKFKHEQFQLSSYLAGLIESDGCLAVRDKNSTAKKYNPKIIIVFKKGDLPLAQYLQTITNCGRVHIKPTKGYVLWQIQDLISVFKIVKLINGYMRTPKIEALNRTIDWLNNYVVINQFSKLPSTQNILSQIQESYGPSNNEIKPIMELKGLDNSPIDSNAWLAGFSDGDGNFSINIHKRSNRNSTRVQLFFRLEIAQTYHRISSDMTEVNFFNIMSKIAMYLETNVLSRTRNQENKVFNSYIVTAQNKISLKKITKYFSNFPLVSSKYLDYKDWIYILKLQQTNSLTTSYLEKAINIRKDFNKTRTTFKWNHLKNCYLKN
jgi:hypothetical protein